MNPAIVPLFALCLAAMPATQAAAALKDGELSLPADYKTWAKFLSEVQRPDAKQVREIFFNRAASTGTAAKGFPDGSLFVMENYSVQLNADGGPRTDSAGRLVKGGLVRIFVMGKNPGWGADVPQGQQTGNWIFASYLPDGQKSSDDLSKCRTCHAPLASKDFVHRFDEYLQSAAKK